MGFNENFERRWKELLEDPYDSSKIIYPVGHPLRSSGDCENRSDEAAQEELAPVEAHKILERESGRLPER